VSRGSGPDLHKDQFSFREGRSTVDAILGLNLSRAKRWEEAAELLVVSLDNQLTPSTPSYGGAIGKVADHFGLSGTSRRCFRNAFGIGLLYRPPRQDGESLTCGVPQKSVLEPLL